MTRAEDEVSIVCLADRAPNAADKGWTALRVDTLAALDEPGVVLAAVTPISTAGLGVFVMSTHLRDYLLVRSAEMDAVRTALTSAVHDLDWPRCGSGSSSFSRLSLAFGQVCKPFKTIRMLWTRSF